MNLIAHFMKLGNLLIIKGANIAGIAYYKAYIAWLEFMFCQRFLADGQKGLLAVYQFPLRCEDE